MRPLVCSALVVCSLGIQKPPPHELKGKLNQLAFLVGNWTVDERTFAPDGTVVKELTGGQISIRPVLRGTYLLMEADAGNVDPKADAIMWLFTFNSRTKQYVVRG